MFTPKIFMPVNIHPWKYPPCPPCPCPFLADIIPCPSVYDLWGLTWSWDDIKGLYSNLKVMTDRQTNKKTYFQLVDTISLGRRGRVKTGDVSFGFGLCLRLRLCLCLCLCLACVCGGGFCGANKAIGPSLNTTLPLASFLASFTWC